MLNDGADPGPNADPPAATPAEPAITAEGFRQLSARQAEILRLVSSGRSSKEIARILSISAHTVETHVVEARRRHGGGGRVALARAFVAWEAGTGPLGLPVERGPMPSGMDQTGLKSDPAPAMNSRQARREPQVSHDAPRWRGRTTAMLAVVIRFFLDAVYVCLFFAGMSGFAYLSHLLVRSAEHAEMDGLVILVLRCVEVLLAAIDGLGIVIASAFLTYRFIVALFRADGDR